MDKNKVTFGLKNVIVFPITENTEAGKPTYGTAIKIPGAVELKIAAKGEITPFYADDATYYQGSQNNGYEGDLVLAKVPEGFTTKILKNLKDANGVVIETDNAKPAEFGMVFEFNGDVEETRHVLYRCSASRPDLGSKTTEDKKEPNKETLAFRAVPRLDNHCVKASCSKSDTEAYASWLAKIYEPTEPLEVV